jgi:hypothetical protein
MSYTADYQKMLGSQTVYYQVLSFCTHNYSGEDRTQKRNKGKPNNLQGYTSGSGHIRHDSGIVRSDVVVIVNRDDDYS